ncbi:alpha/beta hydrolase domain-containing protein [Acidisphaera sp. L21]|nr:hypothetical protein [Acidisphaera sp. L21]
MEDRYNDTTAYERAIRTAAVQLVAEGFMLQRDVAQVVQRAANWGHPSH